VDRIDGTHDDCLFTSDSCRLSFPQKARTEQVDLANAVRRDIHERDLLHYLGRLVFAAHAKTPAEAVAEPNHLMAGLKNSEVGSGCEPAFNPLRDLIPP